MANQYIGSFEHIVRQKFSCSAREALQRCANENMSYQEAEKALGFKHGTIRKWANRFGIKLKSGVDRQISRRDHFIRLFHQKSINKYNILSRQWGFKQHLKIS